MKTYFIISSWEKKYCSQEKIFVTEELNIFARELNFASATKSNISRFQTFANLPKNREIAKPCFTKVSYFKAFWTWTIFYLRVFSIGIHRNCKTKHYFFQNFFPDLEMRQFWSVSYVCQICKLKLLFWTIFILIGSYL